MPTLTFSPPWRPALALINELPDLGALMQEPQKLQ